MAVATAHRPQPVLANVLEAVETQRRQETEGNLVYVPEMETGDAGARPYALVQEEEVDRLTEEEANAHLFPNGDYEVTDGRIYANSTPLTRQQNSDIEVFSGSQPLPDVARPAASAGFLPTASVLSERLTSEVAVFLEANPGLTRLLLQAMSGLIEERETRLRIKIQRQLTEAEMGLRSIEAEENKLKHERTEAILDLVFKVVGAGVAGTIGGTTGFAVSQAVSGVYTMVSKAFPVGPQYQADEEGVNKQRWQWLEKSAQQVAQEEGDQVQGARDQFKGLIDLIRLIADNLSAQANTLFS